jgi:hypothetical protein
MANAADDIDDTGIRELYERAKAGDRLARQQLAAMEPTLELAKSPDDYKTLSARDQDVLRALELLELFDTERRDGDNAKESGKA